MSETILLRNMYSNPAATMLTVDGSALEIDDKEIMKHFEEFYEDVFSELSNFGEIEEMNVCDNIGDHLVGNVYIKFFREEDADKAIKGLNGRFYGGRPIQAEFSPVTDFREARCRQFDLGECTRGGYCNFMHLKEITRDLKKKLFPQRHNKPAGAKEPEKEFQERPGHDDRRHSGHSGERDDRHGSRSGRRDERDHRDYDRRDRERDDRYGGERDDRHNSSSRGGRRRSRSRTPDKRREERVPAEQPPQT